MRTAKVGTQSISKAFRGRPDIEIQRSNKLKPYPKGPRRSYYSFAFVRNPFTRLVSCWRDKVIGGGSWSRTDIRDLEFVEFIGVLETLDLCSSDRHIRPQSRLIPTERISFLSRLESFATDWPVLCKELGVGDVPVSHTHLSPSPAADVSAPVIDQALALRILRLYDLDFRLFGYRRGVLESLR